MDTTFSERFVADAEAQNMSHACAATTTPSPSPPPPARLNALRLQTDPILSSNHDSAPWFPTPSSMPSSTRASSTIFTDSSKTQLAVQPKYRSGAPAVTRPPSINSHQSNIPATPHTQSPRKPKIWRSMGYPAFSRLLASGDDALVIRKFNTLHVRTILMLQDEIVNYEERLDQLDQERAEADVEEHDEWEYHNGSFRLDKEQRGERAVILHCVASLLKKYDGLVLKYTEIKKRSGPSKRVMNSIRAWLDKHMNAIHTPEIQFVQPEKEADLMKTTTRTKSPLRSFLESMQCFRSSRPFKPQKIPEYLHKYPKEPALYYDDDKIDIAINSIILFLGLTMLLVPAWGLNEVSSSTIRLAIITVFIAVFLGFLLLVTPSKPFETMVGTAAYGALLMVFMQIGK